MRNPYQSMTAKTKKRQRKRRRRRTRIRTPRRPHICPDACLVLVPAHAFMSDPATFRCSQTMTATRPMQDTKRMKRTACSPPTTRRLAGFWTGSNRPASFLLPGRRIIGIGAKAEKTPRLGPHHLPHLHLFLRRLRIDAAVGMCA
jgi:hypothetical protein